MFFIVFILFYFILFILFILFYFILFNEKMLF